MNCSSLLHPLGKDNDDKLRMQNALLLSNTISSFFIFIKLSYRAQTQKIISRTDLKNPYLLSFSSAICHQGSSPPNSHSEVLFCTTK